MCKGVTTHFTTESMSENDSNLIEKQWQNNKMSKTAIHQNIVLLFITLSKTNHYGLLKYIATMR